MATDVPDEVPRDWRTLGEQFHVIEIVPPGNEDPERRFTPFSLFLISVCSESAEGKQLGMMTRSASFATSIRTAPSSAYPPATPTPASSSRHDATGERRGAGEPRRHEVRLLQVTAGSTRVLIVHFKVHVETNPQTASSRP